LPSLRFSGSSKSSESREIDPKDPRSDQTSLDKLLNDERNEQVEQALMSLPSAHRAVLVMCDYDDLRYEEIAEILDIPIGTVRSRIHRAREELRKRLEPVIRESHRDADGEENREYVTEKITPRLNAGKKSL
jgi:RNA polymerase sigma-70 factor (ECF subfamily)